MRGILLFALAACGTSNAHQDAPIADVPGGVSEPPEFVGITLAHNQVRAMVNTTGVAGGPLPPLQWDPDLAAYAKQWVMMCRDVDPPIGLVDHDPNRTNIAGYAYIGENIYASSGAAAGGDAVMLWAGEQANYTYASDTCNGVCGHYTQVVWRDTQKVGCALHGCAGLTYPSTIVCDYGPGGNIGGQRPY
jgi:pathogenesis-related protein 1